jgi:hypothetical protein
VLNHGVYGHKRKATTVGLCLAVVVAVAATGSTMSRKANAGTARASYFFFSPTKNLSCEMDYRPGARITFCQSLKLPHAATMNRLGGVHVCRGERCLGNPPENTSVLPYGRSVTVGPFRCTSLTSGVRCVVIELRKGFLIDRVGVARIRS